MYITREFHFLLDFNWLELGLYLLLLRFFTKVIKIKEEVLIRFLILPNNLRCCELPKVFRFLNSFHYRFHLFLRSSASLLIIRLLLLGLLIQIHQVLWLYLIYRWRLLDNRLLLCRLGVLPHPIGVLCFLLLLLLRLFSFDKVIE